jgi:hypothetical protein
MKAISLKSPQVFASCEEVGRCGESLDPKAKIAPVASPLILKMVPQENVGLRIV